MPEKLPIDELLRRWKRNVECGLLTRSSEYAANKYHEDMADALGDMDSAIAGSIDIPSYDDLFAIREGRDAHLPPMERAYNRYQRQAPCELGDWNHSYEQFVFEWESGLWSEDGLKYLGPSRKY